MPFEYLFRSVLAVGAPGCGKTRGILMPLLRELLRATGTDPETKVGLVVADPKNEFRPFLEASLAEVGRLDDLVIIGPGEGCYNPLTSPFLTQLEMVEKIAALSLHRSRGIGGPARDDAFWEGSMKSLLGVCIQLHIETKGLPLTFVGVNESLRQILSFRSMSRATEWLTERQIDLPPDILHSLETFLTLPADSTRPCVAETTMNAISFWLHEPLRSLSTPTATMPAIDPLAPIDQGKIILLACTSAAHGTSLAPLMLALKEEIFSGLLARDQIEVDTENGSRLINQTRPVFIVADEFQTYLTNNGAMGELAALDRIRGFRGGYIAATQNLASLHSALKRDVDAVRLLALFANQVFLANICPLTAVHAEFLFADSREESLPPPLLPHMRSSDLKAKDFKGQDLSRLRTGEFWLRSADGSITKGSAKMDLPGSPHRTRKIRTKR